MLVTFPDKPGLVGKLTLWNRPLVLCIWIQILPYGYVSLSQSRSLGPPALHDLCVSLFQHT